jgi:hypothetical protein
MAGRGSGADSSAAWNGHIRSSLPVIGVKEDGMKFVLLIYQGTTSLPGSDRWKALSAVEQKAIYADYAEINGVAGVTPGLPLAPRASGAGQSAQSI